jgi:hypothetical protein
MMFALAPRLRHSRQNRQTFFNARVELACPVCGGAVAFEPRAIGVFCGRCRSPLHRQPDDDTPLAPTGILPFRISPEEAQQKLTEAQGLAPWQTSGAGLPVLQRRYVPFWWFAAHVVASWRVREYDRVDERYEPRAGGFAADYDRTVLAAAAGGDPNALDQLKPAYLAEAVAYEPSGLADVDALPPTVALSDAWVATRERWEGRIQKVMREDVGAFRQADESSSEYSQERAALVYVPVYLPEHDSEASAIVVDGYSGEVIRAKRTRRSDDVGDDAAAQVPQIPEAVLGVAVLGVIALVMLLMALWLVRRLWWY